jgi:hypothetical protein
VGFAAEPSPALPFAPPPPAPAVPFDFACAPALGLVALGVLPWACCARTFGALVAFGDLGVVTAGAVGGASPLALVVGVVVASGAVEGALVGVELGAGAGVVEVVVSGAGVASACVVVVAPSCAAAPLAGSPSDSASAPIAGSAKRRIEGLEVIASR